MGTIGGWLRCKCRLILTMSMHMRALLCSKRCTDVCQSPTQRQDRHPGTKYITAFTKIDPPTPNLDLSDSLFENFAKYGTSITLQIMALRDLYHQRIAHASQRATNRDAGDASFEDRLPTVHARSSDILASLSDTNTPPGPSWAQEFIAIDWKGLAPVPASEFNEYLVQAGSPQGQPLPLRVMVEARVAVTNRAKFENLKTKLDEDVLYNPRLGQFTLRFRPEANASVIPMLQARMKALDRLVNLVDALGRGGKHIVPDSITLRTITFSYGNVAPAAPPSNQPLAATQAAPRSWKVRLDLARERGVEVVLEAGNPHLAVIDYLRLAANGAKFKMIPAWLVFTLPLYRGLETLQDSWNAVFAKDQGACWIFHKSLDWVTIRFSLPGAKNRRVHLDIRPRDKGGNLTWHVYRPATDPNVNNENDEFNKVLKQRVWSASGNGFKGLMDGAVASWDDGIENLLDLISTSVQTLVGTPPPPQQLQQPQPQPSAQDQQQQQQPHQQQPAPQQQGLPAGRFPQQQQAFLQQQAQQQQAQQQQARLQQQQHMPQPNMHGPGQAQGQAQGGPQQRAGGMGKKNAPVVVLD